jgi:hypothetical protein
LLVCHTAWPLQACSLHQGFRHCSSSRPCSKALPGPSSVYTCLTCQLHRPAITAQIGLVLGRAKHLKQAELPLPAHLIMKDNAGQLRMHCTGMACTAGHTLWHVTSPSVDRLAQNIHEIQKMYVECDSGHPGQGQESGTVVLTFWWDQKCRSPGLQVTFTYREGHKVTCWTAIYNAVRLSVTSTRDLPYHLLQLACLSSAAMFDIVQASYARRIGSTLQPAG